MKTLTLILTALVFFFVLSPAFAAEPFAMPAESLPYKEFEQTGQLVSVKLIPSDKETKLYVIGKKIGKPNTDDFALSGRIQGSDGERVIQFKKVKDYFSTTDRMDGVLHVWVESKDVKKTDEFHFQMKTP